MLLKNLELDGAGHEMLVNGSRGVITAFKTKEVGLTVNVHSHTLRPLAIRLLATPFSTPSGLSRAFTS